MNALSSNLESERDPIQVRLDALADTRVNVTAADDLTRAFLELERSTLRLPAGRRRSLLRIHEALAVTRLNGELVHADTLLLADLERTHSRIVGATGTGLRALRALRALDDPNAPSLETAFLHLDRDLTEWPEDRDSDPRVRAIRQTINQIESIVSSDAPALARMFEVWNCVTQAELPQSELLGTAADEASALAGDDPAWLRQVDALNHTDPRAAFAALTLSWAASRTGWTEDRCLCTAAAIRALPCPATDTPTVRLAWFAQVCARAAELTRFELIRMSHALEQLERDAAGQRDRYRSVLVDCLCARPVTTASQLAADAGITPPPALRLLNRLVSNGSCRWTGVRKTGRVAHVVRLLY